jgi:hypothetical protein
MCVVMIPVQVHLLAALPKPGTWEAIGPERSAIEARLGSLPGSQLILVRYQPKHPPLWDWVYNGADIDHAKIVWARDMRAARNEELLRYYCGTKNCSATTKDRRWWLLDADTSPPQLVPYAGEAGIQPTGAESYVPGSVDRAP